MRNVRHRTSVELGEHSDRLLAHGRKAVVEPTELSPGKRLETAPEGIKIEVVEAMAVSLVQTQQLRQFSRFAQLGSELP